jgi:hypothetical protein
MQAAADKAELRGGGIEDVEEARRPKQFGERTGMNGWV